MLATRSAFILTVLSAFLSTVVSAADVDLLSDKKNCGRLHHVCHENDGVATCQQGSCHLECNPGWVLKNGICAESKAHKKQRLRKPISLCPFGETACPIVGSKSFEDFEHSTHQIADFLSAKGGYECVEISSSLESCGGCASLGQGKDCTKIPNSGGVGCYGGQCVILSCEAGYSLSMNGQSCQKKSRHAGGLNKYDSMYEHSAHAHARSHSRQH